MRGTSENEHLAGTGDDKDECGGGGRLEGYDGHVDEAEALAVRVCRRAVVACQTSQGCGGGGGGGGSQHWNGTRSTLAAQKRILVGGGLGPALALEVGGVAVAIGKQRFDGLKTGQMIVKKYRGFGV